MLPFAGAVWLWTNPMTMFPSFCCCFKAACTGALTTASMYVNTAAVYRCYHKAACTGASATASIYASMTVLYSKAWAVVTVNTAKAQLPSLAAFTSAAIVAVDALVALTQAAVLTCITAMVLALCLFRALTAKFSQQTTSAQMGFRALQSRAYSLKLFTHLAVISRQCCIKLHILGVISTAVSRQCCAKLHVLGLKLISACSDKLPHASFVSLLVGCIVAIVANPCASAPVVVLSAVLALGTGASIFILQVCCCCCELSDLLLIAVLLL